MVLTGTGKKAILDGYSSAGKTGTAQKINPATHTYDRMKYIASFSGFAPVNNPAITMTVIIDSPVGRHHGGDVAAPIFGRIAQQVLEYMNVPHDVEVHSPKRQSLRASIKPGETEEGSPDHLGEELAVNEAEDGQTASAPATPAAERKPVLLPAAQTLQASANSRPGLGSEAASPEPATPAAQASDVQSGAVVLELGASSVVPSFLGKPLREVVEEAQQDGIEVDVLGSGIARQQNPLPGSHLTPGGHVAVHFSR